MKPDQVWPDSVQWNSRSPQGERGLKPGLDRQPIGDAVRRSPQGERGLKLTVLGQIVARDIAPRKGSVG